MNCYASTPFTDQIRSYIKNRCILGIQAKEIFNETKRPLYVNIWNRKRLSSFQTLLIRQILPLVAFSYSRGSKNTSLEENIKCAKISVRLFFSVWTVYIEKIMKTHLKIGLKDWHFVYHMVASIWRIEIKILALFFKHFWKLTQLHSYLNTPRKESFHFKNDRQIEI